MFFTHNILYDKLTKYVNIYIILVKDVSVMYDNRDEDSETQVLDLKIKQMIMKRIIDKKNKGESNMYDVVVSLMGKEVKVLTLMGVVPGKVTEVSDSSVTLVHKHYRQIINMEYIISITEKVFE